MKKIILFTFFLICGANASAQLVTYGPQFTINSTSVRSKGYNHDKSGSGANYGGFVRINIPIVYFQGDLSYSTSEFTLSKDGTAETDYKMSGTDLTLLVGFKLVPLGKLGNVRLFGGYDWKSYSSTDTNNNLNHFDTESNNNSLVIGAGVDVWKFTVDYRYLYGLTDIDRTGGEVKLNQSCFVVGFKF
ncbi:outer membrane beta-barrel protein [Flavobacterium hauense]